MVIKEASSFRDPAGQVVIDNGVYLREIGEVYLPDYHALVQSGLYSALVIQNLMIPHEELSQIGRNLTIKPEQIPFISYPYEWCFSMLKDAAVTTLRCAITALEHGMMMKDASAYNIQWVRGKMQLIDTMSFMPYQDGMMFPGYRQFIEHFLAPLLLMSYGRTVSGKLLQADADGIPVSVTASLLPLRARFRPQVFANIYLPSLIKVTGEVEAKPSKQAIYKMLDSLLRFVEGLNYKVSSTWSHYDKEDSYTFHGHVSKRNIIRRLLENIDGSVFDFGANTGEFSQLAMDTHHRVIALDRDHDCVELLYRKGFQSLVLDLCSPSPAIGWANVERKSFLDRLHPDTIMALALIHHLCIGNNIPLAKVAELFGSHCQNLIIEFVPLEDKKAQILMGKKSIPSYSQIIFEEAFKRHFYLKQIERVEDSQRSIYLFRR